MQQRACANPHITEREICNSAQLARLHVGKGHLVQDLPQSVGRLDHSCVPRIGKSCMSALLKNEWLLLLLGVLVSCAWGTVAGVNSIAGPAPGDPTDVVVIGYNDLGMHCMNDDFSELLILPPFNTLHAQVVDRSESDPHIIKEGLTLHYRIPGNAHSADKTNFWRHAEALFGVNLPADIGLTGNGMAGQMFPTKNDDWNVTGIPITPVDDNGRLNPYPLATITARLANGNEIARSQTVVPVSQELSCHLCHQTDGISTEMDILLDHDRLHNTQLATSTPVLCAACHADNALGLPGDPAISNLSRAIHGSHASRVGDLNLEVTCYACHPGVRTQCQRDVHLAQGITCVGCHGTEQEVADPTESVG